MKQRMLGDSAVERLGEAAAEVLERVGILCQSEELCRELRSSGAIVDEPGGRVRFPARMTLDFARALREEAARSAGPDGKLEPPPMPRLETQVAQFYLDPASGERLSGSRSSLRELARLGESLHPDDGVGHSLILCDVPPILEPLEAALVLAEHASKPGAPFAWDVRQIDYLREMGEILGMPGWASWGAICIAHPLRFDRAVAEKLVRRVREGVSTGITAMPVAGVSTPVTLEGFVAVAAAEHLAAWMACRAVNPSVGLSGSMWGGSVDPATGLVSYSRFDAMRYSFACVELLERWCGVRIPVGGGEYCDARAPGLYAALEKAYKAMTIAAFTGQHPGVGEGMLETGKTISPIQLLLDREYGSGVAHLWREAGEATADAIGLEAVLEVGLPDASSGAGSFLDREHTIRHFRSSLWRWDLADPAGWSGMDSEARALERARHQLHAAAARPGSPPERGRELEAMRRVLARARAALL